MTIVELLIRCAKDCLWSMVLLNGCLAWLSASYGRYASLLIPSQKLVPWPLVNKQVLGHDQLELHYATRL